MKKYIIPSLIALALTACDAKDEPDYTPADKPSATQRVYFATDEQTQIVTEDETSFDVYVFRPEDGDAEERTVQLLVTDESGLFKFPEEVKFAKDEFISVITVGYDVNDMEANYNYTTYIAIDEASANIYGEATLELIIKYEVMTEWTAFGYEADSSKNGLATWAEDNYALTSEVRIMERHVPDNEKVAEYEAQYYIGYDEPDPTVAYDDEDWIWVMTFNTSDGGKTINVPYQPSFLEDGEYYIIDAYSLTENESYISYYDETTGTFVLQLAYVDSSGAYGPYTDTFTLNGFVDTNDYNLTITDLGQTTVAGSEYAMLGFKFDVTVLPEVLYTVVETAKDSVMSEDTINLIAEAIVDPDQTTYAVDTLTKPGNVALSFPQSGYYSIVAVGLTAEGEVKAVTETAFEYTLTTSSSSASAPRRHLAPAAFTKGNAPRLISPAHTKGRL